MKINEQVKSVILNKLIPEFKKEIDSVSLEDLILMRIPLIFQLGILGMENSDSPLPDSLSEEAFLRCKMLDVIEERIKLLEGK